VRVEGTSVITFVQAVISKNNSKHEELWSQHILTKSKIWDVLSDANVNRVAWLKGKCAISRIRTLEKA